MAKTLATYSADKISVLIGTHIVSGYADGTFVQVEEQSDGVTSVAGADGEVARSMSTDPRKTVTLTVLQTSDTNDVLSALYAADKISKNATFSVAVTDLRGTTLFAASTAWVRKSANISFGKEVEGIEWTIDTADGAMTVGGSN